jgi:two-component system LytT family response regulator
MRNIRALIVDDEPLIRRGLKRALGKIEGLEIAGECGSGAQAVAVIRSSEIDVVFLDVQMPDGTGLDVVEQVGPDRMPVVVFVTAHDEYAVKAFELHAVDYLLKPFDDERLKRSVERARARLASLAQSDLVERLTSLLGAGTSPPAPARLVVKGDEKYEFVDVESIDWAESANNYVQLHCGPRTRLLNETLSRIEQRLAPHGFLRVHRCYLVNASRISAVHPMINGTYALELPGGIRVGTGRRYKDVIRTLVNHQVSEP